MIDCDEPCRRQTTKGMGDSARSPSPPPQMPPLGQTQSAGGGAQDARTTRLSMSPEELRELGVTESVIAELQRTDMARAQAGD